MRTAPACLFALIAISFLSSCGSGGLVFLAPPDGITAVREPIVAMEGTRITIEGHGFGPAGDGQLRFDSEDPLAWLGGPMIVPARIISPTLAEAFAPVTEVTGTMWARLTLETADGRTVESGEAIAEFVGPRTLDIQPRVFPFGVSTPFVVTGVGLGDVPPAAFLRFNLRPPTSGPAIALDLHAFIEENETPVIMNELGQIVGSFQPPDLGVAMEATVTLVYSEYLASIPASFPQALVQLPPAFEPDELPTPISTHLLVLERAVPQDGAPPKTEATTLEVRGLSWSVERRTGPQDAAAWQLTAAAGRETARYFADVVAGTIHPELSVLIRDGEEDVLDRFELRQVAVTAVNSRQDPGDGQAEISLSAREVFHPASKAHFNWGTGTVSPSTAETGLSSTSRLRASADGVPLPGVRSFSVAAQREGSSESGSGQSGNGSGWGTMQLDLDYGDLAPSLFAHAAAGLGWEKLQLERWTGGGKEDLSTGYELFTVRVLRYHLLVDGFGAPFVRLELAFERVRITVWRNDPSGQAATGSWTTPGVAIGKTPSSEDLEGESLESLLGGGAVFHHALFLSRGVIPIEAYALTLTPEGDEHGLAFSTAPDATLIRLAAAVLAAGSPVELSLASNDETGVRYLELGFDGCQANSIRIIEDRMAPQGVVECAFSFQSVKEIGKQPGAPSNDGEGPLTLTLGTGSPLPISSAAFDATPETRGGLSVGGERKAPTAALLDAVASGKHWTDVDVRRRFPKGSEPHAVEWSFTHAALGAYQFRCAGAAAPEESATFHIGSVEMKRTPIDGGSDEGKVTGPEAPGSRFAFDDGKEYDVASFGFAVQQVPEPNLPHGRLMGTCYVRASADAAVEVLQSKFHDGSSKMSFSSLDPSGGRSEWTAGGIEPLSVRTVLSDREGESFADCQATFDQLDLVADTAGGAWDFAKGESDGAAIFSLPINPAPPLSALPHGYVVLDASTGVEPGAYTARVIEQLQWRTSGVVATQAGPVYAPLFLGIGLDQASIHFTNLLAKRLAVTEPMEVCFFTGTSVSIDGGEIGLDVVGLETWTVSHVEFSVDEAGRIRHTVGLEHAGVGHGTRTYETDGSVKNDDTGAAYAK